MKKNQLWKSGPHAYLLVPNGADFQGEEPEEESSVFRW